MMAPLRVECENSRHDSPMFFSLGKSQKIPPPTSVTLSVLPRETTLSDDIWTPPFSRIPNFSPWAAVKGEGVLN